MIGGVIHVEIYLDFDFIDDSHKDISLGDYSYKRSDIDCVLSSIKDSVRWAETSPFQNCFCDVYVLLSDSPAMTLEFVDYNEKQNQLVVFLNPLSLIYDYKDEPIYRKAMFKEKWKEIDLYTYVRFILLHELGHIVHMNLSMFGEKNIIQKYKNYVEKYQEHYKILDKKYGVDKGVNLNENMREKLGYDYRKLPHEKFADSFAFNHLNKHKEKDV